MKLQAIKIKYYVEARNQLKSLMLCQIFGDVVTHDWFYLKNHINT